MTAIAVITLSIGVYFNKIGTKPFRPAEIQAPSVLSEETQIDFSPSPTSTSTSLPTPVTTPIASAKPKSLLDSFIYTEAALSNRSSAYLTLVSSSDPKAIIAWYQNKLKQINMPATSVASTNTNGNYVTKMAAASADAKINIEISKVQDQSVTKIIVSLSN